MNYYRIGTITKPHGLKGYVKVHSETDFPERFLDDKTVIIEKDGVYATFDVQDARIHGGGGFVMKFKGIDTPEAAESYRNSTLVVDEEHLHPIDDDEYYIHDIIGCKVYTDNEDCIGTVTEIFSTGSNDIYVVANGEEKELLIPAIKDVIRTIDTKNKRIDITVIEGLFS